MNDLLDKSFRALLNEEEITQFEFEYVIFLTKNFPNASHIAISCALIAIHDQLNGNVCTDLTLIKDSVLSKRLGLLKKDTKKLKEEILVSGFVGFPKQYMPFILEGDRLYLHKYWNYENELIEWLQNRAKQNKSVIEDDTLSEINALFEENMKGENLQQIAVFLSLITSFLIISGGPGTGKTYTVKKIIEALILNDNKLKIALAAPTGKAAERLNASISDLDTDLEATTLHRLLGARMNGEFRYNTKDPLLHDVVIIDEASMLDIRMWIGVIRALKSSAKLIILGDKDQLASVEAGSILGDICFNSDNDFSQELIHSLNGIGTKISKGESDNTLNDHIVLLNKTYRTKAETGIPKLAKAINDQNHELINEISDAYEQINIQEPSSERIGQLIKSYSREIIDDKGDSQFLCSNKRGILGTENLNQLIENKVKNTLNIPSSTEWYEGRRILITKNDFNIGLSNGEIGTCFVNKEGVFKVRFENSKEVLTTALKSFELAYAITVHKSQGSEFSNVIIFLPEKMNPVLTKELLYTGVTRTKESTLIIGNRDIINEMIEKKIKRISSIPTKIRA